MTNLCGPGEHNGHGAAGGGVDDACSSVDVVHRAPQIPQDAQFYHQVDEVDRTEDEVDRGGDAVGHDADEVDGARDEVNRAGDEVCHDADVVDHAGDEMDTAECEKTTRVIGQATPGDGARRDDVTNPDYVTERKDVKTDDVSHDEESDLNDEDDEDGDVIVIDDSMEEDDDTMATDTMTTVTKATRWRPCWKKDPYPVEERLQLSYEDVSRISVKQENVKIIIILIFFFKWQNSCSSQASKFIGLLAKTVHSG